jgi:hypothetical protein
MELFSGAQIRLPQLRSSRRSSSHGFLRSVLVVSSASDLRRHRELASRCGLVRASTRPWSGQPSSPTLYYQIDYCRCGVPRCTLTGVPFVVPCTRSCHLCQLRPSQAPSGVVPCSAFTASATSFVYGQRLLHPVARHLCSTKSPNKLSCRCRHQMENCGADTSSSSFVSSSGLQQHRLSLLGACHRSVALPRYWLLRHVSHECSRQKSEKIRRQRK